MILVEEVLKNVFGNLPIINVGGHDFKPRFDFGTKEDLLKFINGKNKNKESIYPLIWMETPVRRTGDLNTVNFDCILIVATKTNDTKTNTERLEVTFKPVLIPLINNIYRSINKSGKTKILNKTNNKETNYFRFGLKKLANENTSTDTNDIWDAIKIEMKLEVYKSC